MIASLQHVTNTFQTPAYSSVSVSTMYDINCTIFILYWGSLKYEKVVNHCSISVNSDNNDNNMIMITITFITIVIVEVKEDSNLFVI